MKLKQLFVCSKFILQYILLDLESMRSKELIREHNPMRLRS